MYELNGKYMVCVSGWKLEFFYKILDDFVLTSNIAPTTYHSRKKAKRVMRRLNKYHSSDGEKWFVVEKINYGNIRRVD